MSSKLKKFIKRFSFAFEGLRLVISEQVFAIFCVVGLLVFIAMFVFKLPLDEKVILILTVTFVMTLEMINSRIERVLDILHPDHDSRVKIIKDISAAAVLLACLGAVIIGIMIFYPYLKALSF